MTKAIGLLSGGLDSQLAIRLMLEQGIEMSAVHFNAIFYACNLKGSEKSTARKAADELGIPFAEFNITKEMLDIVKNPSYGYGSGINPCIDCKILMLRKAKQYMEETGSSFIVTGEVLGQRPMSQHKNALELIERKSGLCGLIVRPLSCKLLQPTIPEQNGWIDRNKFLDHSGRGRKVQMGLAEKFGMKDYPNAAGGCLLTDPGFSRRVKESLKNGEDSVNDMQLLKIGRHFRLLNKIKLIVGRNEIENKKVINLARDGNVLIEPVNVPGPTCLIRNNSDGDIEDYLRLSMYLCARYCDGNGDVILRYGMKRESDIIWNREAAVKLPHKPMIGNDYCRRI